MRFLHDSEYLESKMFIKWYVFRIMCLKRDHHIIAIGAGNDFIHHHFCETVMLKFRINGEVDDMKSSGFMKLGSPSGVEVIFSEDKVEKCLHSRILVEQPAVCDEAFFQADKIIIKCMTVIGFVRKDQDSLQFRAVSKDFTGFK